MAFSLFVINALVDTITGGGNDRTEPIGKYRSGPKIEKFFLDCGIDMRIGTGRRLTSARRPIRSPVSPTR